MKNENKNIFWIFSGKYGKMSKKVKYDEKVIYCRKRPKLMTNQKKNIFWIFSGKYGKMTKKVKNDEKGLYIAEKGQN